MIGDLSSIHSTVIKSSLWPSLCLCLCPVKSDEGYSIYTTLEDDNGQQKAIQQNSTIMTRPIPSGGFRATQPQRTEKYKQALIRTIYPYIEFVSSSVHR